MAEPIMHQNAGDASLDPDAHLARDWALFQAVDTGASEGLWRCWGATEPVVVVGRNGRVDDDVIQEACREDGVRVLRRVSGGGTVVLGPGCLTYTVALAIDPRPELASVAGSFAAILGSLVAALGIRGLSIAETDLVLGGRKVSGNAQRRGRRALLHHGTLLYGFDSSLAARYLNEPARRPAYRADRCHAEFMGNLPLAVETIRTRLAAAFRSPQRLDDDQGEIGGLAE